MKISRVVLDIHFIFSSLKIYIFTDLLPIDFMEFQVLAAVLARLITVVVVWMCGPAATAGRT